MNSYQKLKRQVSILEGRIEVSKKFSEHYRDQIHRIRTLVIENHKAKNLDAEIFKITAEMWTPDDKSL